MRRPGRLWLPLAVVFGLSCGEAAAEAFSALEFSKLEAHAAGDPQLLKAVKRLAAGGRRPLYLVLPPPVPVEPAGTNGDSSAPATGASWRDAWTSSVLAIYKGELSSYPGATALFVEDLSSDDEVVTALRRLVRGQAPEVFDGDLVVLSPEDLADLRRIVRINAGDPSPMQIQEFAAVQRFAARSWDQKGLVLADLHPAQVTLVAGMRRGSRAMSVIHCFPNSPRPMVAVPVELDVQELVRGLVEILRSSLVPVRLRVGIERPGAPLSHGEREAITAQLALILRRDGNVTMYEQVLERQIDTRTGEVTLLSLVPRSFLHQGSLGLALRSDRFSFVDRRQRRRVRDVSIDITGWSGAGTEDRERNEATPRNSFYVVETFDSGGGHEDFRRYPVPREVVTQLGREECAGAIDRMADGAAAEAGEEAPARVEPPPAACGEAFRYLVAITGEVRIARALAGDQVEVQVILSEPRRPRRPRASSRPIAESVTSIVDYLLSEAAASGLGHSAIHELLQLGEPSRSGPGIDIWLTE